MKYTLHTRDMVWLSLGENCLTDSILARHGVKSFSTPYSHARSNLDYALLLEKNCYDGFLESENLRYDTINNLRVVTTLTSNTCDTIYDQLHMNGFEFTHHDIIASQKKRYSMERKVARLKMLKGEKNFVFFYHHRAHERSDIEVIFEKAEKFCQYYAVRGKSCHMIIFSQKVSQDTQQRRTEYKKIHDNMHYFTFFTHSFWKGNGTETHEGSLEKNQIDFFALNDDDLMKKMIYAVNQIVLQGHEIQDGIV